MRDLRGTSISTGYWDYVKQNLLKIIVRVNDKFLKFVLQFFFLVFVLLYTFKGIRG